LVFTCTIIEWVWGVISDDEYEARENQRIQESAGKPVSFFIPPESRNRDPQSYWKQVRDDVAAYFKKHGSHLMKKGSLKCFNTDESAVDSLGSFLQQPQVDLGMNVIVRHSDLEILRGLIEVTGKPARLRLNRASKIIIGESGPELHPISDEEAEELKMMFPGKPKAMQAQPVGQHTSTLIKPPLHVHNLSSWKKPGDL